MENIKRAVLTLTPAESKRLIAKAASELPEVKQAQKNGRIFIANGTTNGYVAEEILKISIPKERYTAGIITMGRQCVTPPEERLKPYLLIKGQISEEPWYEVLDQFTADDVMIKGANAVDHHGYAGILLADPWAATIGKLINVASARGTHLIIPVGLEKLIPSVIEASRVAGMDRWDYRIGNPVGLMPIVNARVITEIEAMQILAKVKATAIGAGGVGGSEGSVVLALEGEETNLKKAWQLLNKIKGEKALPSLKRKCKDCPTPCFINDLDL